MEGVKGKGWDGMGMAHRRLWERGVKGSVCDSVLTCNPLKETKCVSISKAYSY